MTGSTTKYEESICVLRNDGFGCINLGNGLYAVYEGSKISNKMKVRIWDEGERKYLSSSVFGTPAKGIITPQDYNRLMLSGNNYTLEVTDNNNIVLTTREDIPSHNPQNSVVYTSDVNGTNVSLLVIGGVVVACVIGLTIMYFTKNAVAANEIGLTSAELIGGTALKESVGKFLDIIGSYFILNLMKDDGTPTGFASSFIEAEEKRMLRPQDPLLIDLDGDGIETTSTANGVYFDHGVDGFKELSAWVGEDDGILVHDKNGNGVIDDSDGLKFAA